MYYKTECAVQTGSGLAEWCKFNQALRKGVSCFLVIDWVKRRGTADNNNAI